MVLDADLCPCQVHCHAQMTVAQSFIHVDTGSHFPLQNLPYGVFSSRDNPARRMGVALGNQVGCCVNSLEVERRDHSVACFSIISSRVC